MVLRVRHAVSVCAIQVRAAELPAVLRAELNDTAAAAAAAAITGSTCPSNPHTAAAHIAATHAPATCPSAAHAAAALRPGLLRFANAERRALHLCACQNDAQEGCDPTCTSAAAAAEKPP